jgi:DNA-directed RNA polymerase subunit RPC12/RpoP
VRPLRRRDRAARFARYLIVALVYRCADCGASNEVKTQKVFTCWKCHKSASDEVARDIRLALQRQMPKTLVAFACAVALMMAIEIPRLGVTLFVDLFAASPRALGVDLLEIATAYAWPALSLLAIWREWRWARWPILLGVAATFVGFVGATLNFVDPSGVINIGQPLVLGLLSVLVGTLLVYLVWLFFFSARIREYYAAVAVLPKTPRFRFRGRRD